MSHTPGPWQRGHWGKVCNIPEHVSKLRHPGPPACIYEDYFWASDGEAFLGIASTEPGVSVVWTEYDELKIRPDDAALIATAPELLDALRGMVGLIQLIQSREPELMTNHRFMAAEAAIAKAEGK